MRGLQNYTFMRTGTQNTVLESRKSIMEITSDDKTDGADHSKKKADHGMFFFDIDHTNKIINVDLGVRK